MKLNKKSLIFLSLLTISSLSHSKEEQYICEFDTEVIIGNSTSEKPTPTVKKINEKYTFLLYGENGNYIESKNKLQGSMSVIKGTNRITLIEKNQGDNYFIVSIFTDKKLKNSTYGSIKSYLSYGKTDKFYDPSQSFGSCIHVKS
jgi:hypothetical protein